MDAEERRAKRKAYNAAYYEANRDRIRQQNAAYRKANRNKLQAYYGAYREANREKLAQDQRSHAARSAEKAGVTITEWRRDQELRQSTASRGNASTRSSCAKEAAARSAGRPIRAGLVGLGALITIIRVVPATDRAEIAYVACFAIPATSGSVCLAMTRNVCSQRPTTCAHNSQRLKAGRAAPSLATRCHES